MTCYLPEKFSSVMVVWGEEYITRFLDYCLPSLLAEGNLPAIAKAADYTFYLYSNPDEIERIIKPHPVWRYFTAHFKVCYESLEAHRRADGSSFADAHANMVAAHNHFALNASIALDTVLIFLGPDAIYSSSFFSFAIDRFRDGYRAIMYNALRVERGAVIDGFLDQSRLHGLALDLPTSKMLGIFHAHEHPVFKSRYIGGERVATVTSVFLWKDEYSNRVLRSFHWHPAMIWPKLAFPWSNNPHTVDTFYCQSVLDADDIYFQRDMRDFMALDLTGVATIEGDLCLTGTPSIRQYSKCIRELAYGLDVRVRTNILRPTIIPSSMHGVRDLESFNSLIQRSLVDAQIILSVVGCHHSVWKRPKVPFWKRWYKSIVKRCPAIIRRLFSVSNDEAVRRSLRKSSIKSSIH